MNTIRRHSPGNAVKLCGATCSPSDNSSLRHTHEPPTSPSGSTALALVLACRRLGRGALDHQRHIPRHIRDQSTALGEKIENLFTENVTQNCVLLKLTDRVFFYEGGLYSTVFYVGDAGVLLLDALEGQGPGLQAAIAEVTDLPVTSIVYSHNHADHITDAAVIPEASPDAQIIATEATAAQMERHGSAHAAPPDAEMVAEYLLSDR